MITENRPYVDQSDLGSPRRELSGGGLGIVVTVLVRQQIVCLSACIGRPIQLYVFWSIPQSFGAGPTLIALPSLVR